MKTAFRILRYSVIAIFILSATLVLFAVGNEPETELDWSLTHDDILRAKKILHEGSKIKPDKINTIELSAEDLNLAANYLLNRYSKSAANIEFKNDKLRVNLTMTLPKNLLGHYLNISFRLGNDDSSPLPSIAKFKAGKLLLPAKLSAWVIDTVIQNTSLNEYFILATRPINTIQIDSKKLTIHYYSNPETLIQAKNLLTHGDIHAPALNAYQLKLTEIIAAHDPEWRLSLAEILQPLFELAYHRSTLANAIEENRKVIFTVNDYVNKLGAQQLLTGQQAANDKELPAFLYKRIDLAQHFIGSAALTASVNGQVARVMGEEKELRDAQGGSGFSFIDLAADKAGTRFGEIATTSPEQARNLQKAMASIKDYRDFMPDPRDLPENMNEAEFKQRYQSIDSPTYQEVLKLIDTRIAGVPIYNAP